MQHIEWSLEYDTIHVNESHIQQYWVFADVGGGVEVEEVN